MTFFGLFLKPDSVFWSIFYIFFIYFQTSINGARKVRFERMTPIRKGREKMGVTETRAQPQRRRIQNCEKKEV